MLSGFSLSSWLSPSNWTSACGWSVYWSWGPLLMWMKCRRFLRLAPSKRSSSPWEVCEYEDDTRSVWWHTLAQVQKIIKDILKERVSRVSTRWDIGLTLKHQSWGEPRLRAGPSWGQHPKIYLYPFITIDDERSHQRGTHHRRTRKWRGKQLPQ